NSGKCFGGPWAIRINLDICSQQVASFGSDRDGSILKHRPACHDRADADRNTGKEEQQPAPRGSKLPPCHLKNKSHEPASTVPSMTSAVSPASLSLTTLPSRSEICRSAACACSCSWVTSTSVA